MKILIISGSRADYGLLRLVSKALDAFHTRLMSIWGDSYVVAFSDVDAYLSDFKPDMLLVLGDRFEILAAATAAHLNRIPIAHIGGGDVTKGSYDDAMRDCISRMASVHFATSGMSYQRLLSLDYSNVHLVGSPGVDYIKSSE